MIKAKDPDQAKYFRVRKKGPDCKPSTQAGKMLHSNLGWLHDTLGHSKQCCGSEIIFFGSRSDYSGNFGSGSDLIYQ